VVLRFPARVEELPVSLPRLRAPQENGQILAVPPLDQVGALLEANRRRLHAAHLSSTIPSLDELRARARSELQALASAYHREAGEAVPGATSDVWLVAGHQPELFHPGVWFKNFALHRLAQVRGAMSLNLVIDTDAAKPALLYAPAEGRLARVAFDRSTGETPYEERIVAEESTFAELPRRMAPIIADYGFEPMLPAFWGEVMQQAKRTPLLGERFAAARRAVERRWGCSQPEVPMSRVCGTQAFAWFAWLILERLPAFHAIYNQTVQEYRRAHGIRSRSHPVPDLSADGDWLEAPFWAWRSGQARRGKLMVRPTSGAWALRAAGEDWPSIPNATADYAVDAWRSLEAQHFKIRSRALTTTMFARLFLADLFIHGIGGGLYDELTDRIIERFFAIPAPGYLVLSATLLLPLPRYPDAQQRVRDLDRQLRDLRYKPERLVAPDSITTPLIRAKQEWIARAVSTHAERVERFRSLREINARLLACVGPVKRELDTERSRLMRQAEWDAVAARRDYAFCLYPEEMLRDFFAAVLGKQAFK
jgi:hypothetical protein